MLRYQFNGRRRDMGLGPHPEVTLEMARQKAVEAALALSLKDKAEAAYARGDLSAKRRELMRSELLALACADR